MVWGLKKEEANFLKYDEFVSYTIKKLNVNQEKLSDNFLHGIW